MCVCVRARVRERERERERERLCERSVPLSKSQCLVQIYNKNDNKHDYVYCIMLMIPPPPQFFKLFFGEGGSIAWSSACIDLLFTG